MNKTVNNVFTENGMISPMIPATKNYHMNWDAIQAFQPEKAKVLEEYWDLIKKHPYKNSTPVYDCNTGKIYPTVMLTKYSQILSIRLDVNAAINTQCPVYNYWLKDEFNGHYILAIEDVPISIIKASLENLKTQKREESQDKARIAHLETQLSKIKALLSD